MGFFKKLDGMGGEALKHARKIIVFVIGTTVILVGVLLIVTPGPALVVIPMGLAILATEFVWAKRFLRRIKRQIMGFTRSEPGEDS